jgi:ring-1,2-phenylacetyl-CoA epoxidase subunit PaaE
MPLRVSQIHRETHDTVRIHLEDAEESGRQFDYDAGQYLTFRFDDLSSKPVVRSYTLSSSPEQVSDVAFTVKKVDDGFVSKFLVDDLKEGDVLRARGPIGKFCFDEAKHLKNRFMIAAGSGVTPFLSMIRSAIASGFVGELGLLVSFKTDRDLIAWDELSAWQDKGKLKLHCSLSRQEKEGFLQGRVSTEKIETLCKSWLGDTTFFTCGPDAMMESAKSTLLDMGLEEEQFEMESFS